MKKTRFAALLLALCLAVCLVPPAGASSYSIYIEPFQIITTQRASVRSGPAAYYTEYTMLSKNNVLTAYGRVPSDEGGNDWFVVDYYGQVAYVSTTAASVYGSVTLSVPADIDAFLIVTTQLAYVRKGPASTYKEVAQLRKNTELTALGRVRSEEGGNDWYLIFYEGGLAYVSTIAAEPRQESSYAVPAGSPSILLLTNQLAYVRSGPASTSKEIARVSKGNYFWAYKQVPSSEGGNPWYMIDYYGQIAYISSTTVNVQ